MSSASDSPFLGRGWTFPPTFAEGGAEVEMVSGVEDITQSLQIILGTGPGERVMQEDFGCDLSRMMFEEIDQSLAGRIKSLVSNALLDHEPRIIVDTVDVSESDATKGLLLISVSYTVSATNTRFNLVYPFYLTEATLAG